MKRMWMLNTVLVAVLVVTIGWTAPAASSVPPTVNVDVLVIGGTPGGVAAASAAARTGASVLLVESGPTLGGILSSAWLTTFDMNLGPGGQHLTQGIFMEHYRQLGISFDRGQAARVMGRAVVNEPGLRVAVESAPVRLMMDGDRIAGLEFYDVRWRRLVQVRPAQVIDATDDADVAAMAGAPHVVGRPGYRNGERWMQAVTLVARIGNVNWRVLAADIYARLLDGADPFAWGINGKAAWGYADEAARYRPLDPRVVIYPLNLAAQDDGSVLINAINVTLVDGLDRESVASGMATAEAELPSFVAHLRESVPGFAHAELLDHAPSLYVRETRHVAGLYTLTTDDVLAGRIFHDRIAVASYPIDIHPYYPGWANPYPRMATEYTIPYRSIVPVSPRNLLIASRAFSATSEAHGSARVVPTVMALGQAAGVAAALAAQHGWTPAQIADDPALVRALQGALIAQGAYLGAKP